MTNGHMGIYRDATGLDAQNTASPTDQTYDTEVREDSTFERQVGNVDIQLNRTGHYLTMFNNSISTSTASRTCVFERALYDGTELVINGGGFARNTQGCDEMYIAGAGIFNVASSGADFKIQYERVSSPTGTSPIRRADLPGVQLLKLDDTWDYFRAVSDTESFLVEIGDDMKWENVLEEDSGSFELQHGDTDIEVQDGWYLCCYTVQFICTNIAEPRVAATAWLELDGTEVIGSRSVNYSRLTQDCATNIISCICIFEASGVQDLVLATSNTGRYGGGQIVDSETSIQIAKLPDTVSKCWVYDSTGGQTFNQASLTEFDWGNEVVTEDADFDHDPVTSVDEIVVQTDGAYLFMNGMYAGETSSLNAYRYNTHIRWEVDATAQKYGGSGSYYRGWISSGPTLRVSKCGSAAGIILDDMTANEVVTLARIREATPTTNPPLTTASKCAVSAIYLPSILVADETAEPGSYWYSQQGF